MRGRLETVPIDSVTPDPDNVRLHSERNLEAIRASLGKFAQLKNIVVNERTRRVVAGNATWRAAKALGWKEIEIRLVDMDEREAVEFAIADNRTTDLSEFDNVKLAEQLKRVASWGDLANVGFDTVELSRVLRAAGETRAEPKDYSGEGVPRRVQPGETWRAGPHRVFCGDSTMPEDVGRFLGGGRAHMLATDPPYAIFGSSTGVGPDIADDRMVVPFFQSILSLASAALVEHGHAYFFCDWRSWAAWWEAGRRTDMEPRNMIVWDKGGGIGSMYANCHELIGFWVKTPRVGVLGVKQPGQRIIRKLAANIIKEARVPGDERQHNAAKPVRVLETLIENSSDPGEVVMDPYLGSGSTLIAAERLGRACWGIDIEPHYADVALARWEALTAGTAEREA